ncbi:endo-1,3-alpha-glucanase family glycosylhydrolase, partial [Myxococcota bacterium]
SAVSNQMKQIVDSAGKRFMPQVHPGYYSLFDDGRINWFVDGDLSRYFRENWELAISHDPMLINLVSWNDYIENHHIAASVNHDQAFLDLTRWYSHLYKTGEEPEIQNTKLYLAHYVSVYPHYPMDVEVVGLVADDHDGTACNLSVSGSMDWFSRGDFSVSMWLRFPTGAANPEWSLSKGDVWTWTGGWAVANWQPEADLPISPTLYLEDDTHQYHLEAGTIGRGEWGHFLWTVDRRSKRVRSYMNGVYQGEQDITHLGDISSDDLLKIGQMNSAYFLGTMDELRIYNRVLSTTEVQSLSNSSSEQEPRRGLVVAFEFDTSTADAVGNSVAGHGDPTFVDGVSGSAVTFDGFDDIHVTFVPVEISNAGFALENGLFVYEAATSGCGGDATVRLVCGPHEVTEVVQVVDQFVEVKWHTDAGLPVYDCAHGCGELPHDKRLDMSTVFKRIM